MMAFFFAILVICAFSILFNSVLNQAEEVLAWKPNLVNRLASLGKHGALESWQKSAIQLAFVKVLDGCPKCLAAWLALLGYPFLFQYDAFQHFAFVVLSIYATFILSEKLFND